MYDKLLALDNIKLNFSDTSLFLLNVTLAVIMVGVSLGVRLKRFKKVFLYPKSFLIGIIAQIVILPALTFLLVITLHLPKSIALGLILVAACPGGNISNFISSLAKGNVELSVSLTMFSTLGAAIFTPLNFSIWGNLYLKFISEKTEVLSPIHINFWQMFSSILIILLIPLLIGLLITRISPRFSIKISPYVNKISVVIFLGLIVIMVINNWNFVLECVKYIFLLVLVHNFLAIISGYGLSSLVKLPIKDRRTIAIETGIQNSGLALVLIFNPKLFGGIGGMAAIAAWWGIWHMISGIGFAYFWSKSKIKN